VRVRSGEAVAEVRVSVGPDLGSGSWRLSWSCHDHVPNGVLPPPKDSVRFELAIESATYAPAAGFPYTEYVPPRRPWATAALRLRGTRTDWSKGTASKRDTAFIMPAIQRTDSVALSANLMNYPLLPLVALHGTVGDGARAYVAEPSTLLNMNLCAIEGFTRAATARLHTLP
jgi:hypothetical protein